VRQDEHFPVPMQLDSLPEGCHALSFVLTCANASRDLNGSGDTSIASLFFTSEYHLR
jgi:hypothetical protein